MLYKISLFFEKQAQQDEGLIDELKMIRALQLTKTKETIDQERHCFFKKIDDFKIQNPQFDSQVSSIVGILRSQNVDTLTNNTDLVAQIIKNLSLTLKPERCVKPDQVVLNKSYLSSNENQESLKAYLRIQFNEMANKEFLEELCQKILHIFVGVTDRR